MSKLFSKEFHESSSSWYFDKCLLPLTKKNVFYRVFLDEDSNYWFEFSLVLNLQKKESIKVKIAYDPASKKITSHFCGVCEQPECRHYYSVIHYSYNNLTTDVFNDVNISVYNKDLDSGISLWRPILDNGKIFLKDVYNKDSDKVRVYFIDYEKIDLKNLCCLIDGQALKIEDPDSEEVALSQFNSLTSSEVDLLSKLSKLKCSFSRKNNFFTVYKKDFCEVITVLKNTLDRVYIFETGDRLKYISDNLKLNFNLKKSASGKYLIRLSEREYISTFFTGRETYILKENEIFTLNLAFDRKIITKILGLGFSFSESDLVYMYHILGRDLGRAGCYLDVEENIRIPDCFTHYPKFLVEIDKVERRVNLSFYLNFSEEYSLDKKNQLQLPAKYLFLKKKLIKLRNSHKDSWFYISPNLFFELIDFVNNFPFDHSVKKRMLLEIELNNYISFADDSVIRIVKETIFDFYDPNWDIIISKELEKEFITSIDIIPTVRAHQSKDSKSSDKVDWFEYSVSYKVKDITLSHDELKTLFKNNNDFVKLGDGRLFFIKNKNTFLELDNFFRKSEKTKNSYYKIFNYNLPYLYYLSEKNDVINIIGDTYLDNMYKSLLNRALTKDNNIVSEIDSKEPGSVFHVMRAYQKKGYEWLYMLKHFKLGGILADEMGLGKTLQAISIVSETSGLSIVVCPKTLTFNWAQEIEKFKPNLNYIIYEGNIHSRRLIFDYLDKVYTAGKAFTAGDFTRLIIISYSILQNDISLLEKFDFKYLILDEAQHIKNFKTKRAKAIKKVKAEYKLALTGTPIENNIMEIWSIFDFLMPGFMLKASKFKKEYQSNVGLREEKKQELLKILTPLILRRRKKDVLFELPDKQEQIVYCKLSKIQEKMYIQVIKELKERYLSDGGHKMFSSRKLKNDKSGSLDRKFFFNVLTALTRLRQICDHPSLAAQGIQDDLSEGLSSKTELVSELILDNITSGKKILVFSQYIKMLRIIEKYVINDKIGYEYMDGTTKNRMEIIEHFNNNKDIKVMLLSLKTGGYGINLTSADVVIIVDPWWNPMVEHQAIDRTHRIGQTKKVFVYKTITKGTVEDKIIRLQEKKKDLFAYLIERGEHMIKAMTAEQIKELFEYEL